MLDIKSELITALNTIGIDVSYDKFSDSKASVPCITYIEYQNQDYKTGNTFGYSTIGFTITVWADSIEDEATYSLQVDSIMRGLGYNRITSNEFAQGSLYRKIMDYRKISVEIY